MSFYNSRFVGNSAKNFTSKLRNLRIFLKNRSKNVFGSIKIKKEKILSDILTINKIKESRPLNLAEHNVLANLKKELTSILEKEEVMWKQKSRIQWINECDNNAEFFHKMANGRKQCNTINFIFVNNIELVEQRDLNNAFTNYYKDIFGNKNKRRIKAR